MRQRLLGCFLGLTSAIVTPSASWATPPPVPTPTAPSPSLQLELGQSNPVEVLVVGAEPTEKLRIRPVNGSRQSLNLRWQVESQMTIGDRAIPNIQMPTMQATVESQITDVAANGDISYNLVYRQITVADGSSLPAAAIAQLKAQLQPLEGLSGKYVVSEFGEPKSVQLSFPKTITPLQQSLLDQFSQSITNLSSPLPSTPIGIGSRWRQTTPIKLNGAVYNQTTTYELASRQNGIATIKFSFDQTTNAPANGTTIGDLTLKSLQSQGAGQMTWNLQQLMPQQSTIDMTAKMVSQPKASAAGQPTPVINSTSLIKLEMRTP
jgi:Family of unknown function (DUF6263)